MLLMNSTINSMRVGGAQAPGSSPKRPLNFRWKLNIVDLVSGICYPDFFVVENVPS
jgi:hypothetical protein